MYRIVAASCLAFLLSNAQLRSADVDVVQRGKAATALVETPQGDQRLEGTAFCVEPTGYFVTSKFVLARHGRDGRVALVLHPGEKNQTRVLAQVIRQDDATELAILKTEDKGEFTALDLGEMDGLTETQQVTAFGYPVARIVPGRKEDYPNVFVTVHRITSLQKKNGELHRIALDGRINRGSTGGPVLGADGKVIGVIQVRSAGLAYAVPVGAVAALVRKPTVVFRPAPVPLATAKQEKDFTIKVDQLVPQKDPLTVEMTLGQENMPGGKRTFVAEPAGSGVYRARAAVLPADAGEGPIAVRLAFADGAVEGVVADRELTVGGSRVKLSQIDRIDGRVVKLRDGKTLPAAVNGLESLQVKLGGSQIQVDTTKATSLQFEPPPAPAVVGYTILVKSGDRVVANQRGAIGVTRAARQTSIGGAKLPAEKTTLNLPGPVDDIIVGGGGRYLLLQIKKFRQLAVFDVQQAKIAKFLPLQKPEILIGAGIDKIVMVHPDQNVMQRWDLHTLERELTVAVSGATNINAVALGNASSGPIMLMTREGPSFWDLTTLKQSPITIVGDARWGPHMQYPFSVRASADGKTFAGWRPRTSPGGMRLLTLDGGTARAKYAHDGAGELLPSSDGSLIFTYTGLYSDNLQPIAKQRFGNLVCLPALQPGYFLGIPRPSPSARTNQPRKPTASVFTVDDQQLLFVLPNLDELTPSKHYYMVSDRLPISRRIFFAPDAKLLVTLPETADRLILRRVDTMAELDKASIDYLFVSSRANRKATRGSLYEYPVKVESKRGGVKFNLQSGPAGMKVSDKGMLTWRVSADSIIHQVSVILAVSDDSGQEVFHSFVIHLE